MTSEAVDEAGRVLVPALLECLEVLSALRTSHSHSDLLLPPDLAAQTLSPRIQSARDAIQSIEGIGSGDELVKDECGLEARKFAFGALDQLVSVLLFLS